jgi:hypothetical protein
LLLITVLALPVFGLASLNAATSSLAINSRSRDGYVNVVFRIGIVIFQTTTLQGYLTKETFAKRSRFLLGYAAPRSRTIFIVYSISRLYNKGNSCFTRSVWSN